MGVTSTRFINRHSVEPLQLTAEQFNRTVYPGQLVWFVPPVSGGKVAARLIDINLEEKTCTIEITATRNSVWLRGTREFHIPFTRVFKRTVTKNHWFTPRFSVQWIDYPTAKERRGEQWQRLAPLTLNQ